MSRQILITVLLSVFIALLGIGIIIPVMPVFATELGANGLALGSVLRGHGIPARVLSAIPVPDPKTKRTRIVLEGEQPTQNPLDVAVEHGHRFAVGEAGDGSGRVGPDARELEQLPDLADRSGRREAPDGTRPGIIASASPMATSRRRTSRLCSTRACSTAGPCRRCRP